MPSTLDILDKQFSELCHALAHPDLVLETCEFVDVLRHLEQPTSTKTLSLIQGFIQELMSWPEKELPQAVMQRVTGAIASPTIHTPYARLRLLWVLDQCTERYSQVEAFARWWLPQEPETDLALYIQSHTLPSAILKGPNSQKSAAFQELMNAISDLDYLPQAFLYYEQWDPKARQNLPPTVADRLAEAEALHEAAEEEIKMATIGGRFSPERYAAIIAQKHVGPEGPATFLETLTDPETDRDVAATLVEALVGWPEDITPLVEEYLSKAMATWEPEILVFRERLQEILDRRIANALLLDLAN